MVEQQSGPPIPMLLFCPMCNARHIDEGVMATRPHKTHACQECGLQWRPALEATVGVRYLPGCKNESLKLTAVDQKFIEELVDLKKLCETIQRGSEAVSTTMMAYLESEEAKKHVIKMLPGFLNTVEDFMRLHS